MNPSVQVTRVVPRMLVRTPGKGTLWRKSYITGLVDGWRVTAREGRGWACDCPDAMCGHVAALQAVIHPDALPAFALRERP